MNLYIDNDNLLSVTGLKNASSGSYMNDATVTATLVDSTGTTVTGQTFPVTLSYVADTDGNYQATLEDALSLNEGSVYTATISATTSSGLSASWQMTMKAIKRTA